MRVDACRCVSMRVNVRIGAKYASMHVDACRCVSMRVDACQYIAIRVDMCVCMCACVLVCVREQQTRIDIDTHRHAWHHASTLPCSLDAHARTHCMSMRVDTCVFRRTTTQTNPYACRYVSMHVDACRCALVRVDECVGVCVSTCVDACRWFLVHCRIYQYVSIQASKQAGKQASKQANEYRCASTSPMLIRSMRNGKSTTVCNNTIAKVFSNQQPYTSVLINTCAPAYVYSYIGKIGMRVAMRR